MELKTILQLTGIILGLLYLWLEYRASAWLWIAGLVMPAVHGFLYFKSGLYADFGMQIYYILASLYGLAVWLGGTERNKRRILIQTTPLHLWPWIAASCLLALGVIYLILTSFTNSTVPFWDALTTAMSIIAMWMLSRKFTEQWLVWAAVDAITVALYIYKGIPFTASLYMLYTILAVIGYRKWSRSVGKEQ